MNASVDSEKGCDCCMCVCVCVCVREKRCKASGRFLAVPVNVAAEGVWYDCITFFKGAHLSDVFENVTENALSVLQFSSMFGLQ